MGAFLGQLVVKITGDTAHFDGSVVKSKKTFGDYAKSVGKAALGIGIALAGIGVAAVKMASDAEETRNKFNVVFKDVRGEADKTAKNLAMNFGLSSTAAQKLLSDTGDLLTGFGFTGEMALDVSKQVNELAVDLASFTNFSGGAEGASAALTKALLGERESIKSLGIAIMEKDVLERVAINNAKGMVFETERQAKAYATLQLAQEQSKNAIGDFARSSGSFANILRVLTARIEDMGVKLGGKLLPIASDVIKIFTELIENLTENEALFSILTKAIGVIGNAIAKLAPLVFKIVDALAPFLEIIIDLAAELIDALIPVIIEVLDVFIELLPIIKPLVQFVANLLKSFLKLVPALAKLVKPLLKPMLIILNLIMAVLKPFLPILEKIAIFISDTLEGAFKLLTDALQGLADAFTWLVQQAVALGLLDKSVLEFTKIKVNAEEAAESVDELTLAVDKLLKQDLPNEPNKKIEETKELISLQDTLIQKSLDFYNQQKQQLEDQAQNIQKYVDLGKNYFGDLFGSLGEALVTGQDGWIAFAQAAVGGIAAVIDALANEALAHAAAEFAKGLAAAANPFTAFMAPGFFSASAAWGAAGLAAKIGAGVVRGLASQIKLADGGVILPKPGGTMVTAAEAGVPEIYIPDRSDIWSMIADRLASKMGNTTNITNNNLPGRMVLNIDGREFYATLSEASRDGRFLVDQRRGLSR